MLRLPDTANGKLATVPAKCRIKYLNPDFRYDLAEFEQLSLGVVDSVTGASRGKRRTEGAPTKQRPQAEAGGWRHRSVGPVGDMTEDVKAQIGSGKTQEAAGPKRAALSVAEQNFAAPYEGSRQQTGCLCAPTVSSCDKRGCSGHNGRQTCRQDLGKDCCKACGPIVDKIVERLSPPR